EEPERAAGHAEGRSEYGQNVEVVADPRLQILRTNESGNRYAVGRTRSEVGGRQVLDGRARERKSIPDGTGDGRHHPKRSSSGLDGSYARNRLGQGISLGDQFRRPRHLQARSEGRIRADEDS